MEDIQINTSNNDEESIFLTSSDDDKDHESIDRDEYLAKEDYERDEFDDASDNDDYAFGNSYEEEDRSRERRPIKVYDEYDPENIDYNDDDSDDDIPLNMYNRNRKLKEAKQTEKDSDIEEIDGSESSSEEEKDTIKDTLQKKRGRPKRTDDSKQVKKPKNTRKTQVKSEPIKKIPAKKTIRKDSDSSSVSSVESDTKSKQVKKSITKENVNTESSNKNLVKKQPSSTHASSLALAKPKNLEANKLSQAQNIISGRVINFESGFKIPKRPSNETSLEREPPEKKSKTDDDRTKSIKETVKTKSNLPENKSTKPVATVTKPQSIDKKIEKKPQPVKNGFKESTDFLEALSSSSRKIVKKTSNPVNTKPTTTKQSESSQDKLNAEVTLNNNNNNIESTSTSNSTTLINRVESIVDSETSESTNMYHYSYSDSNLNGLKSNLTIPGNNKKLTKKKVVWADTCAKQLENVQFFYLDESERVIKKEAYRGADMSKMDKLNEKELSFRITSGHGFGDFNVEETVSTWPVSLTLIDLPETTIIPEIKSVEREIQAKREANTLAVLVFKKFMPDSASEPDIETNPPEVIRTKIIPLDDTNLNSSVLSDSSFIQPEEPQNQDTEKFYNPNQEQQAKPKPALLSNPVPKAPLLPTPQIQSPSTSTEASGSSTETPNILNLLSIANLSGSILKSNEDAERLKKILSLVGGSLPTETKIEENKPKIGLLDSIETKNDSNTNSSKHIPDTNNNSKWNNNSSSWSNKYNSNTNNRGFNNNTNQGNQNGRNVFVNNFKRGIGNRPSGDRNTGFNRNDNYNNNYNRDTRGGGGYNRNYNNNYTPNRNRFSENKSYDEGDNKNESKSAQGGRWI